MFCYMASGIYSIENLDNGKLYIGYTENIEKRLKEHKNALRRGDHDNEKLQRSYNKRGVDRYSFDTLWECEIEHLAAMEHWWATILNVHDDRYGYNIRPTHPYDNPKSSIESRRKQSIALTGRVFSAEHLKNLKAAKKGFKHAPGYSEPHKKRQRAMLGKSVVVLNKEGEYVMTYPTYAEASIALNVSTRAISQVTTGRSPTMHGYIFINETNYDKSKNYKFISKSRTTGTRCPKSIWAYNVETRTLNYYSDTKSAANETNVVSDTILRHKNKRVVKNNMYYASNEPTAKEIEKVINEYKPIHMYKDDVCIQKFRNPFEAARYINKERSAIYYAISGKLKQAHGYKWIKYESDKNK